MQLMKLNALSAGLLVALTSASMAQELPRPPEPRPPEPLRTRFCIGSGNCPVLVQVMKNCGSDADQIAQEICTTYLATMASTSLMIASITLGSLGPTMIANFDEIIERVHQAPTAFIGQN